MKIEDALKTQVILSLDDFMEQQGFKDIIELAKNNPEDEKTLWALCQIQRIIVKYIVTLNVASKFDPSAAKEIVDISSKLINSIMDGVTERFKSEVKPAAPHLRIVK